MESLGEIQVLVLGHRAQASQRIRPVQGLSVQMRALIIPGGGAPTWRISLSNRELHAKVHLLAAVHYHQPIGTAFTSQERTTPIG
jgi:hypothetical protein